MDTDYLIQTQLIRELKYRYTRAVDTRDWELLASTLTPDVTAVYGSRFTLEGADRLVRTLRSVMDEHNITVHHIHQPEIEVRGDTATGTWALMDRVIRKRDRKLLDGAAIYRDEYRRSDDGVWRIARTEYERLYEAEISFDDMPSFTLLADGFDTKVAV